MKLLLDYIGTLFIGIHERFKNKFNKHCWGASLSVFRSFFSSFYFSKMVNNLGIIFLNGIFLHEMKKK